MNIRTKIVATVGPASCEPPVLSEMVRAGADEHLKTKGLAKAGDKVVVLSGRPIGRAGATNTLVVHTVT